MQVDDQEFATLMREHRALVRTYGQVQLRCSAQLQAQAVAIAQLQAQVVRLRAQLVLRDTARAWGVPVRGDRTHDRAPCLPLEETFQAERALSLSAETQAPGPRAVQAAERVLCQVACLSHGGFWLQHDQCRRTGQACVMPMEYENPKAENGAEG